MILLSCLPCWTRDILENRLEWWKLDQGKRTGSDCLAEYRQAHGVTHLKIPIGPNGPMGYVQPGAVTKKGKFHSSPAIITPLPPLETPPTHCLLADGLSSTVLPAPPLQCIQWTRLGVNPFTPHTSGFHQLIAQHLGASIGLDRHHTKYSHLESKMKWTNSKHRHLNSSWTVLPSVPCICGVYYSRLPSAQHTVTLFWMEKRKTLLTSDPLSCWLKYSFSFDIQFNPEPDWFLRCTLFSA